MITPILTLFLCFKNIISLCARADGTKLAYMNCYFADLSDKEKNTIDELGYIPDKCCYFTLKNSDDLCFPIKKDKINEYFQFINAEDKDTARCDSKNEIVYRTTEDPKCQNTSECYKNTLNDVDKNNNVLKQYEPNACCLFSYIDRDNDDDGNDISESDYICAPTRKDKLKEYFDHYAEYYGQYGFLPYFANCGDGTILYKDSSNYYKSNTDTNTNTHTNTKTKTKTYTEEEDIDYLSSSYIKYVKNTLLVLFFLVFD